MIPDNKCAIMDLWREPHVYDPRLVASVQSQASFTRLAGTTAYAAKDVMTDAVKRSLEFKNFSPIPGAGVDITNAIMISSNPAASPGSFTLMLYDMPQDLATDNAAYAPALSDMVRCVGLIAFDGYKVNSIGCVYYPVAFGHQYVRLAPGETSLYGVLVADGAYTPISVESFSVKLWGEIVR